MDQAVRSDPTILRLDHVSGGYVLDNKFFEKAHEISMEICRGGVYGLLGPTSSGKTTVLKLITQKASLSSGRIEYSGRTSEYLGKSRRRIVYIPQDSPDSLDEFHTLEEQIAKVLQTWNIEYNRESIEEIALSLGIGKDLLHSKPYAISQGQRHMISLIMALSVKPDLMIMDEPFTALDVIQKAALSETIMSMAKQYGIAFLVSGTDPGIITYVSDFIYVIYCGQIVEYGPKIDMISAPKHPLSAMLLKYIPSYRNRGIEFNEFVHKCNRDKCTFIDHCAYSTDKCRTKIKMIRLGENGVRCVRWENQ
ncbi:MAG: ATP-binding cassette domain-containing protein [Thermoplasmataceae archaeon]|jgi:ABC-type glutathione transport system ATPase component